MTHETLNGTHDPVSAPDGDAAKVLAAVTNLLPPTEAEEVRRWERGERSATATIERLQQLSRREHPPVKRGPSIDELSREIVELGKRSPPVDPDAQRAECRWLESRLRDPDALAEYRGQHVAILNGAVVGAAVDSLQLQLDLARNLGVHPDQFLIYYVAPPGFWSGMS